MSALRTRLELDGVLQAATGWDLNGGHSFELPDASETVFTQLEVKGSVLKWRYDIKKLTVNGRVIPIADIS
jgi:hypothetical protein